MTRLPHYYASPFTAAELRQMDAADEGRAEDVQAALHAARDDAAQISDADRRAILRTLNMIDAPREDETGRPLTVPERLDAAIAQWDAERDALVERMERADETARLARANRLDGRAA